jgi:hypothetical protein
MPYIDQRLKEVEGAVRQKPDIASTPNPLQGMMARTMETMFDRVLSAFGFGGQPASGGGQPGQQHRPGVTWERVKEEHD